MDLKSADHPVPAPRCPPSRPWLAVAGVVLIVACLVPPFAVLARRYLFVESVQFCVFAMAAPALIVLGAPWRIGRLPGAARLVHRLAAGRRRRTSFLLALGYLAVWVVICLLWRLLPVLGALARHSALVVAEVTTLCAAGIGLWLELVPSPPLAPRLARPPRGIIATLAMWSIWVLAYILGFAGHPVVSGYDAPGSRLATVADQEITAFLIWAAAAASFIPVIVVALLAWLKDDADAVNTGVRGWGWPGRDSRGVPGDEGVRPPGAGTAAGPRRDPVP